MSTIKETYRIEAPIEKVWWALTTAEGAEGWGAAPAKMNPVEGGEFSYWGGDIHGINTKVVPMMLLKQDWYGHDDPSKKFKVQLGFTSQSPALTDVHLTHEGEHDDIEKDIKDWREYYFEPIKKLLENGTPQNQVS